MAEKLKVGGSALPLPTSLNSQKARTVTGSGPFDSSPDSETTVRLAASRSAWATAQWPPDLQDSRHALMSRLVWIPPQSSGCGRSAAMLD
nr:hypothetical protein GCM10010200_048540 [Actinomadura rugatobispora]